MKEQRQTLCYAACAGKREEKLLCRDFHHAFMITRLAFLSKPVSIRPCVLGALKH
jgi:hypothetical protein